jgi:hypothetical protein
MMKKLKPFVVVCLAVWAPSAILIAQAAENRAQAPASQAASAPRPSITVRELARQQAPALTGQGEEASKNALAFLDWASASTMGQDELIRKSMAGVRDNADMVQALCDEAFKSQSSDHSRALLSLSLLGEARSPMAAKCFMKLLEQPWPEEGTLVDGEIIEQTALGQLQAKAIDGLAYMRDERMDRLVLSSAGKHPSRIVRAEAIAAYLWNHDYSEQARATLKSVVRKDELIFLDRLVKRAQEPKESFNKKLEVYLKAHPELLPPAPDKAAPERPLTVGQPPKF